MTAQHNAVEDMRIDHEKECGNLLQLKMPARMTTVLFLEKRLKMRILWESMWTFGIMQLTTYNAS